MFKNKNHINFKSLDVELVGPMLHKKRSFLLKLGYRPLLLLVYVFCSYIILSCLVSILLLHPLGVKIGYGEFKTNSTVLVAEHDLPICANDLLDKRHYHYEKWVGKKYSVSGLISKTQDGYACRLLQYTSKLVVRCLDGLHRWRSLCQRLRNSKKNTTRGFGYLQFVFMGDSRVRQQFYNFLKLIPDYDRKTNPVQIPRFWTPFHGDVDVESSVLRLQVSFKWRPIINETVMETIRSWATSGHAQQPEFLFLGMEIYHMMQQYGEDFHQYRRSLIELGPTLSQLAQVSQVIWLNQYPTVEFYGATHAYNTKIHSQKIHHYNKAAQQILRNFSNIRIWDSSNPSAEEYLRGCSIFSERENPIPQFIKTGPDQFINSKPYINCLDYIHIGYVALSQATQLFYNDICNKNKMQ